MYGLTQNTALEMCGTHGLNRKWNLRCGPACLIAADWHRKWLYANVVPIRVPRIASP